MQIEPGKREHEPCKIRYAGFPMSLLGGVGLIVLLAAGWRRNRGSRSVRAALEEACEGERRYQLLAAGLQQLREEESGKLARRVHDDLGQAITAIRFDLSSLLGRLQGQPELQERVRATIGLADEAVKSVRGIALELRPGVLDQLGLIAALEWLGIEFQKRYGVRVVTHSDVQTFDAPHDRHLALFRIAQEALTNVARHARATEVALGVSGFPGRIVMEITDNGCGIPAEKLERPRSFGLISMQELARLAGAQCLISSANGTTVRVTLPVKESAVKALAAEGESS